MSFLKHLASGFKVLFHIGTAIAAAAEPWVDAAVPGIAGLFNSTLTLAVKAEGIAEATGQNTPGSGATKAAAIMPNLVPLFTEWATQNNTVLTQEQIQRALDSAVAFANALQKVEPTPIAKVA